MSQAVAFPGAAGRCQAAWAQAWASALLIAALALAWPAAAAELPALTGRVVDNAGMIDPATKAALERSLRISRRPSSDQIVVATIPSLDGEAMEALCQSPVPRLEARPGGREQWRSAAGGARRPQDAHRGGLRAGRHADRSALPADHREHHGAGLPRRRFFRRHQQGGRRHHHGARRQRRRARGAGQAQPARYGRATSRSRC